ncbi:MAG: hypothetical protein IT462_05610 [Planctomycetes bacterium]|nr:hypothetical protein [Planctomycetota bacterium]
MKARWGLSVLACVTAMLAINTAQVSGPAVVHADFADDLVTNPDLNLPPDRQNSSLNFALREARKREIEARNFEIEKKTEEANDRWREAFGRYDALMKEYIWNKPDQPFDRELLVRAEYPPEKRKPDQQPLFTETWIPLADYINSRLCAPDWPKMLRDRLEMRQTSPGAEMLKRAIENDDRTLMRRCARYYPFSPAGAQAMRMLANYHVEKGDNLLAVRWLGLLRKSWPREFAREPMLSVMMLRAFRDADARYFMEKEMRYFETTFRDVKVDVGGSALVAREHLRELMAGQMPGERPELQRGGWRTLSGDNARNRIAPPVGELGEMIDLGAKEGLQGFQLSEVETAARNPDYEYEWYGGGNQVQTLPVVFPTSHQSGIYVNRVSSRADQAPRPEQLIWFRHGGETRPVPLEMRKDLAYPMQADNSGGRYRGYYGDRNTRDRYRIMGSSIGRLHWDVQNREADVLFAVMGQGVSSADENAKKTGNQIQAFDLADEAKLLFTLPNEKIESEADWSFLQRVIFTGTPLVNGNRLYIAGSVAAKASIETWMFCFNLTPRGDWAAGEGKLVWRQLLCSKKNQNDAWGWGGAQPGTTPEISSIAEQGGMLYVVTHQGCVVGCDRDSGEVCWVSKYSRPSTTEANGLSWFANAPLACGGMVICAPTDNPLAFVLDGISGLLMFEAPRRGRGPKAEYEHVLGVVDNRLIIQGKRKLYSVALTNYRSGGRGPNNADYGSLTYESAEFDEAGIGRGVIAGGKVLVPLAKSIAVYDAENGKLTTRFPLPNEVERGNELFTLTVYCRGEAIKDAAGEITGYKPVSLADPKTGNVYNVEHLHNGDTFTFPSGEKGTVVKETFVALCSAKWLYLFKATDK